MAEYLTGKVGFSRKVLPATEIITRCENCV
jgi:hypothetical protein